MRNTRPYLSSAQAVGESTPSKDEGDLSKAEACLLPPSCPASLQSFDCCPVAEPREETVSLSVPNHTEVL